MTREELLNSPEYWTTLIQCELYRQIIAYMKDHNMNKSQLAEHLGCSRGYVTQLLNGDFDHKISKLVELSLAIGMAPSIHFQELLHVDDKIKYESQGIIEASPRLAIGRNNTVKLQSNNRNLTIDCFSSSLHLNQKVG